MINEHDQWEINESGFTENNYQHYAAVLRIRINLTQMDPEEPLLPRIRVPPKNKSLLVYIKLKINFKNPLKSK